MSGVDRLQCETIQSMVYCLYGLCILDQEKCMKRLRFLDYFETLNVCAIIIKT